MSERYSMKDYQPLTMSERKVNLDNDINDLNLKKAPLTLRKQEIEFELSKYKDRVRGKHLPQDEYNEICQWQRALSQEKLGLEVKLSDIKVKIAEINKEKDVLSLNIKKIPDSMTKDILTELRDKYMAFSSDTTRVSSMRAMSSKFVEEIQVIIKSLSNQ